MSTEANCIRVALLGLSALLVACGPNNHRATATARPTHLVVGPFAITSERERIEVADDGEINVRGAPFGRVSPDGRFTDDDGRLVIAVDAEGRLSEPGNPRAGWLREDGTVEWNGSPLVTIDGDGNFGGAIVHELRLGLHYEGPTETRAAALLIVAGVVRLVQLGRRVPGAGAPPWPDSPQAAAEAVCRALLGGDEQTRGEARSPPADPFRGRQAVEGLVQTVIG